MKESYREGVAGHPGPEPCEGGHKAALEALDRGICRRGMELRNRAGRGAGGVRRSGRQPRAHAIARAWRGPAESKTPSRQRNSNVLRLWFQALRRRSQRSRLSWERFRERLGVLLPPVQILQPYPSVRFDANHPNIRGKNRVR
jgi:hypothetical protein